MSWLSDITNDIANALKPVDDFVNSVISTNIWYIAFVFLILFGIFVLWKFKGAQFVTVREQAKHINPIGNVEVGKKEKNHRITSFQAFCVGLGARVGIGNITGVTSAIIMGGAGAVFWMWIFALIGAGTSLVECTLGQMFKERKSDGHFHGGPAYYILKGMKNHKFALFIAFWIILAYGIGFNANQAANVSSAFVKLPAFADIGAEAMSVVMAFIIAALTAVLVFGGIRRIAKASEIIVPIMVCAWLVIGIIVIIIGWNQLGWALGQIFENAFNWQQIFAGFAGSCIMWGLKRGVYSNESGIGSMPNVASQADVSHPIKQGIVQAAGVYMDTLVVCSITAFMVLTCLPATATHGGWSSIWGSSDKGTGWAMSVVQDSMSNALGGTWILYLLAIMIFVFAFSSLIANYAVAEGNIRFMKDSNKTIQAFRVILVVIVFLACIVPIDLVWDLCDVFMAITAICNIVALCFLWKYARVAWNDWKAQKKAGVEEPVFDVDKVDAQGLDMSGVTEWHAKQ